MASTSHASVRTSSSSPLAAPSSGTTNQSSSGRGSSPANAMFKLNWMQWSEQGDHWDIYNSKLTYCDVAIACSDGCLLAHSSILSLDSFFVKVRYNSITSLHWSTIENPKNFLLYRRFSLCLITDNLPYWSLTLTLQAENRQFLEIYSRLIQALSNWIIKFCFTTEEENQIRQESVKVLWWVIFMALNERGEDCS